MPGAALAATASASAARKVQARGLTVTGVWLFLIGLLVVGSGFTAMRPVVMNLALHPYLVAVALAFPLVVLARIGEFPVRILAAILAFTTMYCFSLFNGGAPPLGEVVKIASAVVTMVTCALLIRSRADFVAAVTGLSIAIAILAYRGLQEDPSVAGIEVMEGANKNTYSLFALPTLLLAGFICIRLTTVPLFVRGLLLACCTLAVAAIFMSGNRSGYLGAVVVGAMLFWDRRGRGMLLVAAVGGAIALWMVNYGDTATFNERMKQTVEGNESDENRIEILKTCAKLALENPIIGVSPQRLPFEIGRNTHQKQSHHMNFLDSHNVFGHVAAGSGLICFTAMLALAFTMSFPVLRDGSKFGDKDDPARIARNLMRMMVILWAFRGLFTREVLYNPACNIALGLVIGYFILAEATRTPPDPKKRKSPGSLPGEAPVAVRAT
jgi:hypothetical protein